MISLLNNLAFIQDADQIGLYDCAEPVGNHQHGVLPFKLINGLLHQPFALGVEGAGGFIQDEQLGIAKDGAGQGEPLALATTEPIAPFADQGVEAIREVGDEAGGLGLFRSGGGSVPWWRWQNRN